MIYLQQACWAAVRGRPLPEAPAACAVTLGMPPFAPLGRLAGRDLRLSRGDADALYPGLTDDAQVLLHFLEARAVKGLVPLGAAYGCPGLDPCRVDAAVKALSPLAVLALTDVDGAVARHWRAYLAGGGRGGDRPCPKAVARLLCGGDGRASEVLDRLAFRASSATRRMSDGSPGVVKSWAGWQAELALSRDQVAAAFRVLRSRDLVRVERVRGKWGTGSPSILRPNYSLALLDVDALLRAASGGA